MAKAPNPKPSPKPSQDAEDALTLLSNDHRTVQDLFDQYEDMETESEKEALVRSICNALIIHTTIEEEIFYPALRGPIEEQDLLDEALVEHDGAKVLIAELLNSAPDHDFYDAKVRVLAEEIRHHVREEESEMFPQAREAGVDLAELGRALQSRKVELRAQIETAGPPMPVTRTFVGAELELGAPLQG